MSILRVPVIAGITADWVRKVASAINQLITTVETPVSSVSAGLPVYADNSAATAGGLKPGALYRTSSGALQAVY